MEVAVDLDGPCYEFARTMRYMLNHYRGRNLPPIEEFWFSRYPDEIPEEDWKWVFTEGLELGVFRYGHMTKDTRVGLERLVEMGHQIVIITNRPEEAIEDTKEWVEFFYKGIPHELHILHGESPDKSPVIDGGVLIDDHPDNIVRWAEAGRSALFWKDTWNGDARFTPPITGRIYEVNGWKGVVRWFEHAASAISKADPYWSRA